MSETAVYVSSNSFIIEDKDTTSTYVVTARVKVNCSGVWKYSSIVSSSYDGSDTTITLFSSVLTDPCGECDVASITSGPTGNTPRHDHSDEHTGGLGVLGAPPDHLWNGTYISFEQNDGSWGPYVDLQGDSINPSGDWSTATSYSSLDVVENDGSGYMCIASHTSDSTNEPGVGVYWEDYWMLLVSKGDTGSTGDTGATGDTGDSFSWEGAWATATGYLERDVAENDGSSYTCIAPHTSDSTNEPGVGTYWEDYWDLVAQKGDTGDTGAKGDTGDSITWQGDWSTATGYTDIDVVENDGSSYICIDPHTSDSTNEPGVGVYWEDYWDLIAQKGDTGEAWNWQGAWATATSYAEDDGVGNDGDSYICIDPHTSDSTNEPGVGVYWEDYWDTVVEKGDAGEVSNDIFMLYNFIFFGD
jgi:hypothetical protein